MSVNKHLQRKLPFLLLLAAALSVAAQNPRSKSLTIADGLSQGMIYDIEQTADGFLWFATKDGLNRYDGYRFEVFTNDPFNPFSIAGNDIFGMFEDSGGNLWIHIEGKGVDVLEKNSGRFLHFPYSRVEGEERSPIPFAETPDGTIWAGTASGLLRIRWKKPGFIDTGNPDLESSVTVEVASRGKSPGKTRFFSLAANPDGSLIASILLDGVYKFTPADGQLTPLLPTPNEGAFLWQGSPGRVWMKCRGNFWLIENGAPPRPIPVGDFAFASNLITVIPDGRGNLIFSLGIENESPIFSISEEELLRNGRGGQPKLIYQMNIHSPSLGHDRSGNLWLGTSGYGLRKMNLSRQPFQHFLEGTSPREIMAGDEIYLAEMAFGGCARFDEASNTLQKVPALPQGMEICSFSPAKGGGTYFIGKNASGYFLCTQRGSELTWQKIPASAIQPHSLLEDSKGRLWTGNRAGRLLCFLPDAKRTAFLDFSKQLGTDAEVNTLFEDARQNLWVGTTNGMMKLDIGILDIEILGDSTISNIPISQYQTDPRNPRSLRHNFVTSFCADPLEPERYLWVSTKGGGLNLLDLTTGEFQHFTSQNSGLPNDVVYGCLPDDDLGNIWCSTNRGISRLTVANAPSTINNQQSRAIGTSSSITRTYRFRNFREFDGLQSDEFNTASFARGKDGRLFFGGVNGLTAFYPSEIIDRKSDAQVLITGLKINNLLTPLEGGRGVNRGANSPLARPIHRTEKLRLDHTQNLVTLEFALMDFVNPEENRFRYRLQGVDPDWVEAGTSHVANYARLRSGSYIFEVQGSIGGGDWSVPATLRITVLPPWWATWWAWVLYVLAAGGAAYLFYKNRLRQKLEHQESLRLRELDEFKSRFFTNITHEFRTPLTVILGTSEQLATGSERWAVSSERPAVKGKLSLIKRNGESLLRLINQILDLAKLESNSLKINYVQGDVLPYLRYVTESLHSLSNAQNVLLRVESDQAKIVMDYDPERLLQIVHNLLSNAIKFTPSGGRVLMSAVSTSSADSTALLLAVSDTGVGIPAEDLPKIFDRFYQADNLKKAKAGGTGIGLSLTKELVKAMGGEISVESEVGKGTTFAIRLPITNKAAASDGVTSSHAVTLAAPENLGGNLKLPPKLTPGDAIQILASSNPQILLIEDNPDVVEYLAACLGENYQLDFAYNGKAGIEKALETIPDLIISDVMMPEKDGFEVCDFLKNDERTSHIPIVLLTAKVDMESRIAGLKRGADAYLAKPFHEEELAVTLANLLELRRKLQARYLKLEIGKLEITGDQFPISQFPISTPPDPEDAFLLKLRTAVESRLSDGNLSVDDICKIVGMSHPVIHRKVTALTGRSLTLYVRSIRLARAKELLLKPEMSISEVAYEAGFNDPKFFSRVFSEEFGGPPSEWRNP